MDFSHNCYQVLAYKIEMNCKYGGGWDFALSDLIDSLFLVLYWLLIFSLRSVLLQMWQPKACISSILDVKVCFRLWFIIL